MRQTPYYVFAVSYTHLQGATQEDAVNIAAVKHGIIEYVYAIRDTLRKLYDTDLMQGGGHIRGYAVEGEAAKQVTEAFAAKQNSLSLIHI